MEQFNHSGSDTPTGRESSAGLPATLLGLKPALGSSHLLSYTCPAPKVFTNSNVLEPHPRRYVDALSL